MKKYYSLVTNGTTSDIYIYGDITSWEWFESDVSSYTLVKELDSIESDIINVYINSYGGEVAEGLAIYNALKRHKAKIITYCDGFACSIASVIFMAGEERIMSNASLLMIHNAWTYTVGNSNQLRKEADDLETITQASINAYLSGVNIDQEELQEMLDNESWITPEDSLKMGFATSITNNSPSNQPSQSARMKIVNALKQNNSKENTVSVTITDIPEFQQLISEIKQEIIKNGQLEPTPTPKDDEPKQKTFFNF